LRLLFGCWSRFHVGIGAALFAAGVRMKPNERHRLWLLLLPYVGLLWVPLYNFRDPTLIGIPFFYWYQLAWVPVTSLLTWIAYRTYADED
jgi:hypothetical protein